MTQLTFGEVEEWLDAHPDLCQDYFLRKTDLPAINVWLVSHGFLTIDDYMTCSSRRGSGSSQGGSSGTSPNGGSSYFSSTAVTSDDSSNNMQQQQHMNLTTSASVVMNGNMKRNNSKRCLRHDFARSKSRSVFRTHEVIGACSGMERPGTSSSRRSSLKDMRK
jgi:dual 3',5'-cyclic-AMP and -GMP phosphodiesterase 11